MSHRPPHRSVLQGGQRRPPRRRRARRRLLLLAALLALGGVGLSALRAGTGSDRRPSLATDAGPVVLGARPAQAAPKRPSAYARRLVPAAARVHPRLRRPPRAGLLWDLDTGAVLWERRPERRLRIASLTKMLTAVVVADDARPGERVRIRKQALNYRGSGVGVLPLGKRVRLETLLYGLLLPSGNDAAIALAQHEAGTVRAFVRRMNRRGHQLGLRCSRFASPSGIVDRGNYACARDLALLGRAVLRRPRLARIVRTRDVALPFPIKGGKVFMYNHNPLLRVPYPGTLGIKTGYTNESGRCLVAAVRRGNRRLGVVLLGSYDPSRQARRLFDLALGRRAHPGPGRARTSR